MTKPFNYKEEVEMLIWGMKACVDDEFEKWYENDILNWIDALSEIRREMQFGRRKRVRHAISTKKGCGKLVRFTDGRPMYYCGSEEFELCDDCKSTKNEQGEEKWILNIGII